MIKINIIKEYDVKLFNINVKMVKQNLNFIFKNLKIDNVEVNLKICRDKEIQILNEKYRQKQGPTDVLTFVLNEKNPETKLKLLGDIIISADKVVCQAEEYRIEKLYEFYRLLIHGVLHLKGYTHETEKKLLIMNDKTEEFLKKIIY